MHTFKIGIYPGAILPFIIGYWADAATAVGDITATEEASGVETIGPEHDKRIQGCLLADGRLLPTCFNKTLSALIHLGGRSLLEICLPAMVFGRHNTLGQGI